MIAVQLFLAHSSYFILLSYLLPLTVCLILQVFDETCFKVLHSLLGIALIRFSSRETGVGERESESKVEGKETERLQIVILY